MAPAPEEELGTTIEEITQSEFHNWNRIFRTFDRDGSGTIDVHELGAIMRALGINLQQQDLRRLLGDVDGNNSGEIEFDEFLQLMLRNQDVYRQQQTTHSADSRRHIEDVIYTKRFISDSHGKALWDTFMLCCFLYYAIVIQIRDVANNVLPDQLTYVELCFTLAFVMDLFISFNTAFTHHWQLVVDPRQVARHYLRGWFLCDVAATIPLDIILRVAGHDTASVVLGHLRLLHLFKVPNLFAPSAWEERMNALYIQIHYRVVPLMRLVFWSLVLVHSFAIIHWSLATEESEHVYIDSLYWVTYTISAVGYGDVPVDTAAQRLYACVLFLITLLLNGIIVGRLSVYFQNSALDGERKAKMRDTLAVMEHFNIPTDLRDEILGFQAHLLEHSLSTSYRQVLEGLPAPMQDQLGLYVRIKYISMVELFQKASHECRVALAQSLTNVVVPPEEFIIVAGEEGVEMFFLGHGFADVIAPDGTFLATIKKGEFFGEVALLVDGIQRTASIKALTYCDLFRLNKQDFRAILNRFPKFKEIMHQESKRRLPEFQQPGSFQQRKSSVAWTNPSRRPSSPTEPVVSGDKDREKKKETKEKEKHVEVTAPWSEDIPVPGNIEDLRRRPTSHPSGSTLTGTAAAGERSFSKDPSVPPPSALSGPRGSCYSYRPGLADQQGHASLLEVVQQLTARVQSVESDAQLTRERTSQCIHVLERLGGRLEQLHQWPPHNTSASPQVYTNNTINIHASFREPTPPPVQDDVPKTVPEQGHAPVSPTSTGDPPHNPLAPGIKLSPQDQQSTHKNRPHGAETTSPDIVHTSPSSWPAPESHVPNEMWTDGNTQVSDGSSDHSDQGASVHGFPPALPSAALIRRTVRGQQVSRVPLWGGETHNANTKFHDYPAPKHQPHLPGHLGRMQTLLERLPTAEAPHIGDRSTAAAITAAAHPELVPKPPPPIL